MNSSDALLQCERDRENERTDIDTDLDHDCKASSEDGCDGCSYETEDDYLIHAKENEGLNKLQEAAEKFNEACEKVEETQQKALSVLKRLVTN